MPAGARVASVDSWTELAGPAPIGALYVAWSEHGLVDIEQAGDPGGFELLLAARRGGPVRWVDRPPEALADLVRRAIAGEAVPELPLDLRDRTAMEAAVLHAARTIPWGEARPYAWLAREVGRPRAVRAVGSIMARNTLPFVVPCHRVIRTDGHIGGYGTGGPAAKRALLRLEGVDPDALDDLADAGVRYLGDPATETFCFPTCALVRPVPAEERIAFRSGEAGLAAGWRPCAACRPLIGSPFGGLDGG